jgi:5-methylcytosine-specific restriction endonuclease McrA
MFREARNCGFVRDGGWLRRRYVFAISGREVGRLGAAAYARAARSQLEEPVPVMEEGGRGWWWYRDRFWCEDEGCDPSDVVALVAERERRRQRRLDRAHAALRREQEAADRREPLPRDLRLAVWERDRGRCRECGSGFDLQYDHVIPVALGGASSVENLQLLCGDCNRAKGAAL